MTFEFGGSIANGYLRELPRKSSVDKKKSESLNFFARACGPRDFGGHTSRQSCRFAPCNSGKPAHSMHEAADIPSARTSMGKSADIC